MAVTHLHEEQFDGWLHSACYRLDAPAGDARIVGENVFSDLHRKDRCKLCTRVNWPHGGDPE